MPKFTHEKRLTSEVSSLLKSLLKNLNHGFLVVPVSCQLALAMPQTSFSALANHVDM